MTVSWQDRLDEAGNVHDIVEIARDFLATWDRHELAALPEPCRPGKIFDANDVTSYAFQLMQHDCEGNSSTDPLLHKMASFFSNASVRCSQILGSSAQGDTAASHAAA